MRIVWAEGAFEDIDRLDTFLRRTNPAAADKLYLSIIDAVRILTDFPLAGRQAQGAGAGFRELVVPFSGGGYIVLYFVGEAVIIARIRHQHEEGYPPSQP